MWILPILTHNTYHCLVECLLIQEISLSGILFQNVFPTPFSVRRVLEFWEVKGLQDFWVKTARSHVVGKCSLEDGREMLEVGRNRTQCSEAGPAQESREWTPNWFYRGAQVSSHCTLPASMDLVFIAFLPPWNVGRHTH